MKKTLVETAGEWTVILKALADETRLKIIYELLNQEASVNKLADILDLKKYNISKHLKILEENGLISGRKESKNKIYKVTEKLMSRVSGDMVLKLGCCEFKFNDFKK